MSLPDWGKRGLGSAKPLRPVIPEVEIYVPDQDKVLDMQVNDVLDTTPEGIALIKKWESFEAHWYKDPVGIWTVGYGTTDKMYKKLTGRDMDVSEVLTEKQATKLLVGALLTVVEPAVERVVNVPLRPYQFSACVSFCYNVGPGNFKRSTLLKKINAQDFAGAAEEFERWAYATNPDGTRVKLRGLSLRREDEKKMFLGQPVELTR